MARPKGAKTFSEEQVNKVTGMLKISMTQKKVGDFYNVSLSAVKRIIMRKKLTFWKEKMRWKKKLRRRCNRRLLKYVRTNNKQQLYLIAAQFSTLNGRKLSVCTIRR